MAAKPRLGSDPLDALLPREAPPAPKAKSKTKRATFALPVELVEQLKNATVALSGPPVRLTLAALATNALTAEIARLEQLYNKGRPFPKRESEPRLGRPIG